MGLGCGAREAWEGIPRAPQANTNLLSPQRHVNSDRERVSLSLSPGRPIGQTTTLLDPRFFAGDLPLTMVPQANGTRVRHYTLSDWACNIHMKNTPAYNEHPFFRLP